MIVHENNKWVLKTADGSKVLGTHESKEEAEAQERAIEASKHAKDTADGECSGCGKTVPLMEKDGAMVCATHDDCPGSKQLPKTSKKDGLRRFRLDFSETLRKPVVTPEGYLRLDGKIARTGIQIYRDSDGREVREYRPAKEVFDQHYLDSFVALPLTEQHPSRLLDQQTARTHAVGAVSMARKLDDKWVGATMAVWDKKTIESVKAGRSQLSVGYSCEVFDESGEHEGERYDKVQRNIVANHLAIVDAARAGSEACLKLDATGNGVIDFASPAEPVVASLKKELSPMPHKMKLDGFEIEVADANVQAIIERAIETARKDGISKATELQSKFDASEKKTTELQGKVDVLEAKVKEDAEKFATFDARVEAAGRELGELREVAHKVLGQGAKLDGGEIVIKKLVLTKIAPTVKLDDKNDDYVRASFNTAVAMFPKPAAAVDTARTAAGAPRADEGEPDARQKMIERFHAMNGGKK